MQFQRFILDFGKKPNQLKHRIDQLLLHKFIMFLHLIAPVQIHQVLMKSQKKAKMIKQNLKLKMIIIMMIQKKGEDAREKKRKRQKEEEEKLRKKLGEEQNKKNLEIMKSIYCR